jgi:shikimate dehydrogenase
MKGSISGKTMICGIIGDPIEHTMSPAMHNAAFKALGLDYVYVPFKVQGMELRKAIEGIRGLNLRGVNVTIPHKVAVMKLLDKIDPLAEKIGAVNTIVNDGGILAGFNTDAIGFLQTLHDRSLEVGDKNVVLLGAGGAARAIGNILTRERARLTILNRKQGLTRAEELAHRLSLSYKADVKTAELTNSNLKKALNNADLLINATSLGMSPENDRTPVPADLLNANLMVFDIIYNPFPTRLLREAKAAGAKTIDGLEMLVWQGAAAFEIWTAIKPPSDVMRQSVLSLLQKNEK